MQGSGTERIKELYCIYVYISFSIDNAEPSACLSLIQLMDDTGPSSRPKTVHYLDEPLSGEAAQSYDYASKYAGSATPIVIDNGESTDLAIAKSGVLDY